ncbi:MAG: hypothetical protein IKD18_03035 [Clostridia bacterium]|nr:hypothetical protein [Clostridia bacterium]
MLDPSKGCRTENVSAASVNDGACCIDTYRIYDSCRNQECLEDMTVLVTDEGQKILDVASAIRVKSVKILWTRIHTEEMPFHKGYFQINARYFFHVILDCCTGLGTGQDVAGLCVYDKSVLLYGGEGSVAVFKSDVESDTFCPVTLSAIHQTTNHPRAVVEVAEPVALRLNVLCYERDQSFGIKLCDAAQIPEMVTQSFQGSFRDPLPGNKVCYLSLGIFSLIRIERPAQLVIPACDCCIPSGTGEYDLPHADPCSLFRSMDFPVGEFYPEMRSAERCGISKEESCRRDPCKKE